MKKSKPWWLYISELGLDAPLIAVMWLLLFAQTWRVNYHPWEAYAALGFAVWSIRIIARLLEAAMVGDQLRYSLRYRKVMRVLVIASSVIALILTVLNFPMEVYQYLLLGGFLVIGYFALSLFSGNDENEVSYAKHLVGGIAFAYGTTLTAHVYLLSLGIRDLLWSNEFLCFAVLCLLALAATDLWRISARSDEQETKASHELALSLPLTLLGAAALVFAVRNDTMTTRPFYYAILTGAALLQVLNKTQSRFHIDTVKVLAAGCLLVPGVVFEVWALNR